MERVENIVGKGENDGYQYFLHFQKCFQKTSCKGVTESRDCVVTSISHNSQLLPTLKKKPFENTVGKMRKCCYPAFSPFPTKFSRLPKTNFNFSVTFKRRKCWLLAFSLFPTMFSNAFFFRVVNSQNCVVEN